MHSGTAVIAPSATRELLEQFAGRRAAGEADALTDLTDREREIFRLAARGMSNSEIAAAEFVSEATVKTHISRILAKLGLRDRVQLGGVRPRARAGLVHEPQSRGHRHEVGAVPLVHVLLERAVVVDHRDEEVAVLRRRRQDVERLRVGQLGLDLREPSIITRAGVVGSRRGSGSSGIGS